MALYAALRESHAATTVTGTAAGKFRSEHEQNLAVVKSSQLELYVLKEEERKGVGGRQGTHNGQSAAGDSCHSEGGAKLQCVGRYDLYGNVEAMAFIRLPGRDRDHLFLVFKDAKLSILEYDNSIDDIVTVSLHLFEDDEIRKGRVSFGRAPILRVDPLQRCAALLVYESRLIVLPFKHKGSDLEEEDEILTQPNKKFKSESASSNTLTRLGAPSDNKLGILPTYVVDLDEAGIKHVVDFTFLDGYYEPTISFLHENSRTWAGRLAVSNFTGMITTVSLNISQRRQPVIWSASRLPHNSRYIVALPAPAGGVVVVSSNALIYRNHEQKCALKLNEYAIAAGDGGNRFDTASDIIIFDTVHPVRLEGYQMLFSLVTGESYIMGVQLDTDGNTIKALTLDLVDVKLRESGGFASSMCRVGDSYLFLGSRLGDSSLVKMIKRSKESEDEDHAATHPQSNGLNGSHEGHGAHEADDVKQEMPESSHADPVKKETEAASKQDDSSDDDLYGNDASSSKPAAGPEVRPLQASVALLVMFAQVKDENSDSDDELYGGATTGDAAPSREIATTKAEHAPAVNMMVEMDDEDAAMYD
eukprot:762781-Hanusia_phi.AAC.3